MLIATQAAHESIEPQQARQRLPTLGTRMIKIPAPILIPEMIHVAVKGSLRPACWKKWDPKVENNVRPTNCWGRSVR
jgi:hypothetical protein